MNGTAFARPQVKKSPSIRRLCVIGGKRAIGTVVVALTVVASLMAVPAYSQSALGKRPGNGGYDGPPPDNKPKIDEKAYKSALERIPEPDKKYDPWGVARTAEPAKPGKKSNQ